MTKIDLPPLRTYGAAEVDGTISAFEADWSARIADVTLVSPVMLQIDGAISSWEDAMVKKLLLIGLERNPFNDRLFNALCDFGFELYVVFTVEQRNVANNTYWMFPDEAPYQYRYRTSGFGLGILFDVIRSRNRVCIFTGYASASFLLGMLLCRVLGVKYLVFTDTPSAARCDNLFKGLARYLGRLLAFRASDGILASGTVARNAIIAMRYPPSKIVNFPYVAGSISFLEDAEARTEFEDEIGARACGKCIVFFSGQMIYRKGLDSLLHSLSVLKTESIPFFLLIEGAGPQLDYFKLLISVLQLENDAMFLGFCSSKKHARHLSIADIVVSPSRLDPWGNIVPEAMCLGKAIVACTGVASAVDRIIDGYNGFLYNEENVGKLSLLLMRLILDDKLRKRVGSNARFTAAAWSPRVNAVNLCGYLVELSR